MHLSFKNEKQAFYLIYNKSKYQLDTLYLIILNLFPRLNKQSWEGLMSIGVINFK
jgi:hypothetical protein